MARDKCQNTLLWPIWASNFGLFVTGHENRGDFDSDTSTMTVALLANKRASHAARTTSCFTLHARVELKPK